METNVINNDQLQEPKLDPIINKQEAASSITQDTLQKCELNNSISASKPRPFECLVCKKRFTQKQCLTIHLRYHANERPFKCEECEKSFPARGLLTVHMRSHSGEKPHECKYCHKRYSTKAKMWLHTKTHDPTKPFKCTLCEKTFPRIGAQKRHMLTHNQPMSEEDKLYVCSYCEKRFGFKCNLKAHVERVHMEKEEVKEKAFQCNLCGKCYSNARSYTEHMSRHSDEKPFECDKCDNKYSCKRDLQRHVQRVHTEMKITCPHCPMKFHHRYSLRKHTDIYHSSEKKYVCYVCGKKFACKVYLDIHLKHHENSRYQCTICLAGYDEEEELKNHVLIVHSLKLGDPLYPSDFEYFRSFQI